MDSKENRYVGGLIIVNHTVSLPEIVESHIKAGYSVVPMDEDKIPLIEWREYQNRAPTRKEIAAWIRQFSRKERGQFKDTRIRGWARVTGGRAEINVLDDDTKDGGWLARFGLQPHVRTRGGGLHWIFRHPGWPVKTLNSKSSKKHTELFPLLDIRADGGYSLIYHTHPDRYQWLRPFDEVDDLSALPEEVRVFFGLLHAPKEGIRALQEWTEGAYEPIANEATDQLLKRALTEARENGRNNGGHWLIQQLHDHGCTADEIEAVGYEYVNRCPGTNTRGEPEPYLIEHYRRTMHQVLVRPRREPWLGDGPVIAEALTTEVEELKEAQVEARGEAPREGSNRDEVRALLDRILVPYEIGEKKKYPPWAIWDVIRLGCRMILFGRSGSAKSYAATDLVRAAVTGTEWMGKQVRSGSVIYVAAEDAIGIQHRIGATIREKHGGERFHEARVLERSLALTNPDEVKKLLEVFDFLDEKPGYVIVDSLSLCMGDGDPNEGTSAKQFIEGCQMIQDYRWRGESKEEAEKHPITVIVIHHTNKLGTYNGSMYFQNFVDAMSEVTWDTKGEIRTIFAFKQRHGEWHKPMSFVLREVNPEESLCVVDPRFDVLPKSLEGKALKKLTPQEHAILTAIVELRDEARLLGREGANGILGPERGELLIRSGVPAGSFQRFLNKLIGAGLVEKYQIPVERGEPKLPARYPITEYGLAIYNNPDLKIEAGVFRTRKEGSQGSSGGLEDTL